MTAVRVVLILALVLTVCAARAEPPRTLTELPAKPAAPELALKDTGGKLHRLADSRGKVVMVNFWATWCPPCRDEIPSMQRAWGKLKGEPFEMLAVDVGEDEATIAGFFSAIGMDPKFPILLDRDAQLIKAWPVMTLPTTFIVDAQGRIVYRAVGERAWDDPQILEKIRALMRTPSDQSTRND